VCHAKVLIVTYKARTLDALRPFPSHSLLTNAAGPRLTRPPSHRPLPPPASRRRMPSELVAPSSCTAGAIALLAAPACPVRPSAAARASRPCDLRLRHVLPPGGSATSGPPPPHQNHRRALLHRLTVPSCTSYARPHRSSSTGAPPPFEGQSHRRRTLLPIRRRCWYSAAGEHNHVIPSSFSLDSSPWPNFSQPGSPSNLEVRAAGRKLHEEQSRSSVIFAYNPLVNPFILSIVFLSWPFHLKIPRSIRSLRFSPNPATFIDLTLDF